MKQDLAKERIADFLENMEQLGYSRPQALKLMEKECEEI